MVGFWACGDCVGVYLDNSGVPERLAFRDPIGGFFLIATLVDNSPCVCVFVCALVYHILFQDRRLLKLPRASPTLPTRRPWPRLARPKSMVPEEVSQPMNRISLVLRSRFLAINLCATPLQSRGISVIIRKIGSYNLPICTDTSADVVQFASRDQNYIKRSTTLVLDKAEKSLEIFLFSNLPLLTALSPLAQHAHTLAVLCGCHSWRLLPR